MIRHTQGPMTSSEAKTERQNREQEQEIINADQLAIHMATFLNRVAQHNEHHRAVEQAASQQILSADALAEHLNAFMDKVNRHNQHHEEIMSAAHDKIISVDEMMEHLTTFLDNVRNYGERHEAEEQAKDAALQAAKEENRLRLERLNRFLHNLTEADASETGKEETSGAELSADAALDEAPELHAEMDEAPVAEEMQAENVAMMATTDEQSPEEDAAETEPTAEAMEAGRLERYLAHVVNWRSVRTAT